MNDLGWEDFNLDDEEVIDDTLPIGQYRAVVIEGQPKRIDFNKYSCVGLKLKFKILQVLEVEVTRIVEDSEGNKVIEKEVVKVVGDEYEHLEGKYTYDDVAFQHESEKGGMAKRRKMVALRLGLIHPNGILTKKVWQNVVGKEVILRLVENKYTDKKTGEEKIGEPQVGFFDGYERADKSGEVAQEIDYDDI